ncbi:hypothetical protein [Geofilum rubicundum]|nr:hypothetical protein [Geofilum rubicundum]
MNTLQRIKKEFISDNWENSSIAQFRFNPSEIWYQVASYHWKDDKLNKIHPDHVLDTVNFPVIIKGFTAYLLHYLGDENEQVIIDRYYKMRLREFREAEDKKPGSSMRNLDAEFYHFHISHEKEFVVFSKQINPYINKDDIELIQQYTEAYFNYIQQVYSPKNKKDRQLSVSDWSIVFYYLDEASSQEGTKTERMIKFIQENNVVNIDGDLTTFNFLNKEYHKIKKRINLNDENSNSSMSNKNPQNPLPPERIKNILPFLKKNENAYETADNDRQYLTDLIE